LHACVCLSDCLPPDDIERGQHLKNTLEHVQQSF
jgi:hypothetical protein